MWQNYKNIYHFFVAVLANILFDWPSKKIKMVGVTGTDGKTTTVSLIYHILKNAGYKVSMLSSIEALINDKSYDTGFHVTTPSPISLQKFLKKAKDSGSEYFILEVTSHALDQNRVWGIPFKVGVLTNISNEHLDYHGTYDEYLKTKSKLLVSSETPIINKDDKSYARVSKLLIKKSKVYITYGTSKNAEIGLPFLKKQKIEGEFNRENFLAAIAACTALGVSDKEITNAIKSFKFPKGRLDVVYNSNFKIVIDFAHTPNAFEKVLSYLRKDTKGRLIHVFGSAGERDKIKRPEMGKISDKYSDLIILTSEDPRSEDPLEIIEQIKKGIKTKNKVQTIPDRDKAIHYAVKTAKKGDLILVTGKAHEKSMNYGKGEKHWDEYEVVKESLKI